MERTRICFFCSLTSLDTGMPLSTYRLVEHCSRTGNYDVRLVVPDRGEMWRKSRALGVPTHVVAFARLRGIGRPAVFILAALSALPAGLRLWMLWRKHSIQIVHFSDIIDLFFYPVARLAGCRVAAHLRVNIENRFVRLLYRAWTALFVDRVVCISQAVYRHSGLGGDTAVTVYNPGPSPELFNPAIRHEPLAETRTNAVNVLAVGKFVEVKGHDNFVTLARMVEDAGAGRQRYFILGSRVVHHQRYYEHVMARIEQLGLAGKLLVLDPVSHDQVPRLLCGIDVFVHVPCWQEGLGGAVLEAMAMRIPVVAFDSGAMSECFTDGVSGFIVKHMDTAAAAEKVALLVNDRALRLRMGTAGRTEVLDKFRADRHFDGIERVYRDLRGLKHDRG